MIAASNPHYAPLAENLLAGVDGWEDHATVILDIPTGYALETLERMPLRGRRAAVIITPATHPGYHDVLASYIVRQVVPADSEAALAIMRILIRDDAFKPAFQPKSGLTKMEARVLRYVLRGWPTDDVAHRLNIKPTTVHDHVSNARLKLGMNSRFEMIGKLLMDAADPSERAMDAA